MSPIEGVGVMREGGYGSVLAEASGRRDEGVGGVGGTAEVMPFHRDGGERGCA